MRRTIVILCLLIIIIVFTASGSMNLSPLIAEPGPGEQEITVYFPSVDLSRFNTSAMEAERRFVPKTDDAEALARLVIEEMIKGPVDSALSPVFAAGSTVSWVSLAMDWAGVGLEGTFASDSAPDFTLMKYCVVLSLAKTFEELEGSAPVREVSLYFDDLLLKDEGAVSGILSPQDVVLGITDRPISYRLTLYYPTDGYDELVIRVRDVEIETSMSIEEYIMQELMQPSDDSIPAVIPAGVELRSKPSTQYGICTVDFSEQFYKLLSPYPQRARAVIYSIVNSLCALTDAVQVQRVRITVEGESDVTLGGIDLSGYLTYTDTLF